MNKNLDFDKLLDEALKNAQTDRALTMQAYDKVKQIFDIDLSTEADESKEKHFQALMLIGTSATKLLEQLSRSNDQIIKLSQLKEKEESRKDDGKNKPFRMSEVNKEIEEGNSKFDS